MRRASPATRRQSSRPWQEGGRTYHVVAFFAWVIHCPRLGLAGAVLAVGVGIEAADMVHRIGDVQLALRAVIPDHADPPLPGGITVVESPLQAVSLRAAALGWRKQRVTQGSGEDPSPQGELACFEETEHNTFNSFPHP